MAPSPYLRHYATRGSLEKMPEVESIGRRVKRERLALGLTQRQLAELVEVGVPHISKVEADRERPSEELILRLAEVFKLDSDELTLVAGRLPADLASELAADPAMALKFLRTFGRGATEK